MKHTANVALCDKNRKDLLLRSGTRPFLTTITCSNIEVLATVIRQERGNPDRKLSKNYFGIITLYLENPTKTTKNKILCCIKWKITCI